MMLASASSMGRTFQIAMNTFSLVTMHKKKLLEKSKMNGGYVLCVTRKRLLLVRARVAGFTKCKKRKRLF